MRPRTAFSEPTPLPHLNGSVLIDVELGSLLTGSFCDPAHLGPGSAKSHLLFAPPPPLLHPQFYRLVPILAISLTTLTS